MGEHQCFTASATAYLRNLNSEDLRTACYAVHYQRPPEKTERGTSIGLRFPLLIVAGYAAEPAEIAERVARILNKHWDDPASDEGAALERVEGGR